VGVQKSGLDEKQKEEIALTSSFVEKQVLMARDEWTVKISKMRCLWFAKNMT